jgi:hypothetical protein
MISVLKLGDPTHRKPKSDKLWGELRDAEKNDLAKLLGSSPEINKIFEEQIQKLLGFVSDTKNPSGSKDDAQLKTPLL